MFEEITKLTREEFSDAELTLELADIFEKHGFSGLKYRQLMLKKLTFEQMNSAGFKALRSKAWFWEAVAMLRLDTLKLLLSEAKDRELPVLLMKGTALSFQLYSNPGLRPCIDIDVFIKEEQIAEFLELLQHLGFKTDFTGEKSVICSQFNATKFTDCGHPIVLDVHYQINNQAEYARYFKFPEMYANSVSVTGISSEARALSLGDAYILACIHLQGHYAVGEPIKRVWLYDIHLLLQAMDIEHQKHVLKLIDSTSVDNICAYWTHVVSSHFKTKIPDILQEKLDDIVRQNPGRFLNDVSSVMQLWSQFYYLENMRSRLIFLRQLFCPPKKYMRTKYPESKLWVGFLYLRRIITGFIKIIFKKGGYFKARWSYSLRRAQPCE